MTEYFHVLWLKGREKGYVIETEHVEGTGFNATKRGASGVKQELKESNQVSVWCTICRHDIHSNKRHRPAEGNQILVRLSPQMASRDCVKWPFSSWSFSALNPIYMTNSVTLKLLVSSQPICHSFLTFCSRLSSFSFFPLTTVIHFFYLPPIHPQSFSLIFDICLCAQNKSLFLRKVARTSQ